MNLHSDPALLDTGHYARYLRRRLRDPRFAFWYFVTRLRLWWSQRNA